jgi:predicted transcriptional regulator of viral defense system
MTRTTSTPVHSALKALEAERPRAFRLTDLRQRYKDWRSHSKQEQTLPWAAFLPAALESGELEIASLRPELDRYTPIARYLLRGCTPHELASTLKPAGYFSHGTAASLHRLTDQVSRTFYVNSEQSAKPAPTSAVSQPALDRAFKAKQRTSKFVFTHAKSRFVLLSGKNTQRHGVEAMKGPSGEMLMVTNLERTLVDLVVRPAYGGGIVEVLEAFRAARGRLNAKKLLATLEALKHLYPYHQAIGFLLARADYPARDQAPFKSLGFNHDFYLSNAMVKPEFDSSWRIYYPKGF